MTGVLAFDVGKTGCRGARFDGRLRVATGECSGSVGVADRDGVPAALRAVERTAAALGAESADRAVLGLAGLGRARQKAPELAAALARSLGVAEVVLTSDMVTNHVGALAGRPGVVIAAGTGVVGLGVDADGRSVVCDGWGYLLGDDGSGYAVGRAGLASALRHHDGRGGSAELGRLAEARFGSLDRLPTLVHGAPNPAREVAAFARDVLAAAEGGDADAVAIWQRAGADLARCAAAAARLFGAGEVTVAATGGLFDAGPLLDDAFTTELSRRLPAGLRVPAQGDALDGAWMIGTDRSLPHADLVLRFPAETLAGTLSGRAPASPADDHGPVLDGPYGPESRDGLDGLDGMDSLDTEAARPDLADLDVRSTRDLVALIAEEDAVVPQAVGAAVDAVAAAVDVVVDRLRAGGRLVYLGAGTPGRLAVLDAAELLPTYGVGDDVVMALIAGGREAVTEAAEGAEDDEDAAVRDVAAIDVGARDVVVGVTASGRTPYVIAAVDAARKAGATTVGICNNADSALSRLVDHPVEVLTGPEVVAGSTRMKAGTAQKLVLNTLSTAVMVRLGKVYGNRMVDMRATNAKLRRRARRTVAEVTGADAAQAESALEAADGHAKTAIVALLAGVDVAEARARLERSGGWVRPVVEGTADAPGDRGESR